MSKLCLPTQRPFPPVFRLLTFAEMIRDLGQKLKSFPNPQFERKARVEFMRKSR